MRPEARRPIETPPSVAARQRLRSQLQREIAEFKVRMSEATLRSSAYLELGAPEAAAEVAAEQQELIDGFRERVDAVVSGAAVEREAERVLADELDRDRLQTPAPDGDRVRPPLAAGLAAAAVVLTALLLSTGSPMSTELLGATPADDEPVRTRPVSPDTPDPEGTLWSTGPQAAPELARDPLLDRLVRQAELPDPSADRGTADHGLLDRLLSVPAVPLDDLVGTLAEVTDPVDDGTLAPEPEAAEPPSPHGSPASSGEEDTSEPAPEAADPSADATDDTETDGATEEPDAAPSGEETTLEQQSDGVIHGSTDLTATNQHIR